MLSVREEEIIEKLIGNQIPSQYCSHQPHKLTININCWYDGGWTTGQGCRNKTGKIDLFIIIRQVTETACCSTGNSEHALFWPFIALQVFDRCASLLGYFVHVHFTHYVNWPVALSVFGRGLLAVLLDLMVIIAQYNIEICFWIIKVSNHIKVKCWFWL